MKLFKRKTAVLHTPLYRDNPLKDKALRAYSHIHSPYYECYGIYLYHYFSITQNLSKGVINNYEAFI